MRLSAGSSIASTTVKADDQQRDRPFSSHTDVLDVEMHALVRGGPWRSRWLSPGVSGLRQTDSRCPRARKSSLRTTSEPSSRGTGSAWRVLKGSWSYTNDPVLVHAASQSRSCVSRRNMSIARRTPKSQSQARRVPALRLAIGTRLTLVPKPAGIARKSPQSATVPCRPLPRSSALSRTADSLGGPDSSELL